MLPAERKWVRDFHAALAPLALSRTYVNAITDLDPDAARAAYGPEKYERLAAVKQRYDPDNTFHRNVNIKPAGGPPRQRTASSPPLQS